MSDDATPTLYDWGGGREPFERWLNAFYDLVEADNLLAGLFGGTVSAAHRRNATTWWCEVMGGPADYTENRGGYPHMLARHRDLAITPEQRLRFVTLLSRAADEEAEADPRRAGGERGEGDVALEHPVLLGPDGRDLVQVIHHRERAEAGVLGGGRDVGDVVEQALGRRAGIVEVGDVEVERDGSAHAGTVLRVRGPG